jgi:predicted DNA-binding transcriptional regulator YafY
MPKHPRNSQRGKGKPPRPGLRRVSKAERWLNLLAFLLDHRYPVTRKEILSQVEDYKRDWATGDQVRQESTRRKFERDKSELRQLGITIEPERQKVSAAHSDQEIEAYRLKPADLYLPYLELSGKAPGKPRPYALPAISLKPDEFLTLRRAAERVLALGESSLGASASSALRKLSFDLPDVDSGAADLALKAPVDDAFEAVFGILRAGVESRRPVSCRYYSIGRDVETKRIIEPYGLMLSWGTWYCIARARDREAIRVFRVSRMRDAELLEQEPQFTVPKGFSVRSYLDRAPWELSEAEPVSTRVRIAFPHSRWVLAEGLGEVIEATDADGGALLEFEVRAAEPFVRWLLPFGSQAEVVEPSEIRDRLAAERHRLRALYR